MRVVLGLSLTATSAVWALVDTKDGAILADEVVALDSVNEIARATARSVQAFALQSDRDIDGIRMTWTDDGRDHGIRLRSKLRLFGFDTIEHVTEEEAREGRNQTARHIAPHLTLAYGAARAHPADEAHHLLRRLTSRVPVARATIARVPMRITMAASIAAVCAVAALGVFATMGGSPSQPVETANAEPAPAAAPPAALTPPARTDPAPVAAPAPARQPAAPAPQAPVVDTPAPASAQIVAEPQPASAPQVVADPQPVSAPEVIAQPRPVSAPQVDTDTQPASAAQVTSSQPATTPHHMMVSQPASGPDTLDAPAVATDPTAAGTLPAEAAPVAVRVGQPHLTDSAPLAGPSPAQAVKNPATAPAPPQNPLDILSALP
ncbi:MULTISPECIES: hypothetical protein [Mycobacteriaceae]|uniref:Uncharacterized protein n=1 Tax=Mycolicibacterium parafortuitum TaxID=39692 RepID=A0ACC6MFW2_MYCPF|nr:MULTISPECIES: hypothetical protein [Mycobacteriaceae]MDZ5085874.1 hypothetical protein [Mycolicibacterium parafortuitum]GFM18841.1 uncharacterized protein PO1_contig-036-43 [Mycobacterium sp. PO1]GFM24739.1 uncharacterized protein PO2_contig-047-43 [Mycobacterium sp. PO2]